MVSLSSKENEQIFRGLAPLSTFSAKINIAHAFHVFGKKTKRDLNIIKEIRNVFTHASRNIQFSTKELSDLCSYLYYPDNILAALPNPNPEVKAPVSFPHAGDKSDPRSRYGIACQTIGFNLASFDIHNFDSEHRVR